MNSIKKLFIGLIAALIISSPCLAQTNEVIVITEPDQLKLIGRQISYFEDATGELRIEEVLDSKFQNKFIRYDKDVFSRPGTPSAFWFKLIVQNQSEEDAWLEIGSTYAWFIDFYSPDNSGFYNEVIETGTMRPDANKLYDVNFFWLPLNKAKLTESRTFYVRVISGLTFELPLQVGTIRSLSKNKDINDYLTAAFIGILVIMLLYNAFLYVSTKDHIYFFYLGYLLLMAISMPYANGYPFIEKLDFLFFNKAWWNHYFVLWHTPVYAFVGLFCIKYLDLAKKSPRLTYLIQFEIIIISGVFPFLNLIGFEFVNLVNLLQVFILLFYLTCLITGYYYTFKGHKQAYYYVLGWTFMVTGAFIFFAVINGYLPFNPFSRNILYVGVALEVWMFSLALGDRLNILQREKRLIELENIRLIEDQNEILELKVKNRTIELESKNSELIQSNEELKLTTTQLDVQGKVLNEINSTKDRLFAIIGHDLRSPILSLKGLLDLMSGSKISKEEFLIHSKNLKTSIEHVHFTLNNLLLWAKSQMGGMSPKPKHIELYPLAIENQLLLQELAQRKGIKVVIKIAKDIVVYADSDQANIVFRNLLSNALKFTESKGEILLKAIIKDDFYKISITDTGVGLTTEKLENLFKSKPIASKPGTEGEKGTGLGLTLCKYFVESNGGEIWAENNQGPGSTFYFTLLTSQSQ